MGAKPITGNNAKPYPLDVAELNAAVIQLQVTVAALVVLANELKADKATLLGKLDSDAGVTATDFATTCATAAPDATF